MKRLFLLLLSALVLGACDKDESVVETWTVASEKGCTGVWSGFGFVPADIVKRSPGAEWQLFTGEIEGFTFEEGWECTLQVRIDPIPQPMADSPVNRYTMERLISRIPARSVEKEAFCPQFDLTVASQRGTYGGYPCYWIKDLRYSAPQRWEPLPLDIEGFDYTPGCEYTLRVRASAEREEGGEYGIRITLVQELGRTETGSEGLPG